MTFPMVAKVLTALLILMLLVAASLLFYVVDYEVPAKPKETFSQIENYQINTRNKEVCIPDTGRCIG